MFKMLTVSISVCVLLIFLFLFLFSALSRTLGTLENKSHYYHCKDTLRRNNRTGPSLSRLTFPIIDLQEKEGGMGRNLFPRKKDWKWKREREKKKKKKKKRSRSLPRARASFRTDYRGTYR